MTVAPRPSLFRVDKDGLAADGLSRSFGPEQAVVDVDLVVPPGEIHAVIGLNGAGKTTLMRLLLGMLRPDRGSAPGPRLRGQRCRRKGLAPRRSHDRGSVRLSRTHGCRQSAGGCAAARSVPAGSPRRDRAPGRATAAGALGTSEMPGLVGW